MGVLSTAHRTRYNKLNQLIHYKPNKIYYIRLVVSHPTTRRARAPISIRLTRARALAILYVNFYATKRTRHKVAPQRQQVRVGEIPSTTVRAQHCVSPNEKRNHICSARLMPKVCAVGVTRRGMRDGEDHLVNIYICAAKRLGISATPYINIIGIEQLCATA